MPISPYVQHLRAHVGHSLLLLPGVTAVIRREQQFLVVRQRDSGLWSLVGGGIEPLEDPADALRREVEEELGVSATVGSVVGAYGGPDLARTLPNGDQVSYTTVAFNCEISGDKFELEDEELADAAWLDLATIITLPRHEWIDRVLRDAER